MLNSYDSYQSSELPWIKQIPCHWQYLRNRNILIENKMKVGEKSDTYQLLSLTKQGVIVRDISSGKGKFPSSFDSYKIVMPGNIVFCLFDVEETPRTVGISHDHGMITGAYNVFEIRNMINPDYLCFYYIAFDNIKAFKSLYTGLRNVIKMPTFMSTKIPFPPRDEQDQIVRFLDWKTSEMAHFIKEKRRQIELLIELKNSLICTVVLHGPHRTANKRDSSVEWIQTIPAHWSEITLFQCATEQNLSNKSVRHQNLLSLSYGKIVNKDINTAEGLLPSSFDTYQIVHDGNVILRLTDLQNDHKSLRVGLSTQTGIITSAYTCLKARDNILPEYLYYLLHAYDVSKVFYGMGGGVRQSIGYADIRRMVIPLPPLDEQQEIVDYCREQQAKIEQMIAGIKDEIALVQELRTKTISDVVTGKVNVRDVEIPQYEPEADDSIDEEENDENSYEDNSEAADEEVE
ncbi:restriction endonuclease subunit S [Desulfitobacterium sp.]|uniref:restriction endonuclease subunit S n=1 Tax=Desulfitobacterium sp. TaxID=49981 RepID=UPI002B214DC2|nr:restriction endonuclease subunit S [Desulfitobacterium sp.]MEA4900554.1 restriction endonuclease subunit S [Desulfitobacterium sp.]